MGKVALLSSKLLNNNNNNRHLYSAVYLDNSIPRRAHYYYPGFIAAITAL